MPASDTEAEASEWLIRLETDPTPELKATFEEWLAADPRNRAAYVRLEKTWRHADVLRKLRPLDGQVDENIIDKFGEPGTMVVTPRRKPWLPWLAAAASLLIIFTAGTYGWVRYSRAGWQAYRTEQGGFQRIALPDGSTASLNTNSEIRVRMTSDRREIVLAQGEALFTVAHDPQRPFDVTAADTVVRAVGTEFSVRLRDQQQVDVIVKEGRVAIDPPDDFVEPKLAQQTVSIPKLSTLAAGESVSVKSRKLVVRKVPAEDMTRKLAWTQGRLWFDRVTLVEAVAEFNRYNRRQIVIDDPSIENFHIGGTFDTQDLDSFVSALSSFGIRADSTPGGTDGSAEIIRLSRPAEAKQ